MVSVYVNLLNEAGGVYLHSLILKVDFESRCYTALWGPVAESYSNRQSYVSACAAASKRSRKLHIRARA